MKIDSFPSIAPRCAALFLAALLPSVFAQTSPVATHADGSSKDDVLVLSPFVVSTSESEDGYLARSSAAANRTKTDLKDVAASIDVLTDQFLNDMGAFSMDDALKYVANLAVYDGNASFDRTNSSQWFDAAFNARGFRTTTTLVDFFPVSIMPIDRYNTESMTFLKGSNAILFGVGSPGGSMNSSYKRPNLSRDNLTLSYTTDSEASHRGEFDVNKVLIKNKLAVRLAGLASENHTFKAPSLDRRTGLYGALNYRPFKNTSITLMMDEGHRTRYLDLNNVVLDSYSPWVEAGKPTFNWKTRGSATALTPEANDAANLFRIQRVATVPTLIHVEGMGTQNWIYMGESQRTGVNPNLIPFNESNNTLSAPDGTQWRLDLTTNVWGNMNTHTTTQGSKSVIVQQQLLEGLHLELAANKFDVEYEGNNAAWANRPEIIADPNELLPNGSPNPNVGKPYLETNGQRIETERREFETMRATLSYEFNLDDKKLFGNIGWGHYKLLGLAERQQKDVWIASPTLINMTPTTAPLNGGPVFQTSLNHTQNIIRRRFYLEPNQTVYQYNGPLADRNIGAGITPGWGIRNSFDYRRSEDVTSSLVGALQGNWWASRAGFYRIVGLYGIRRDQLSTMAKSFSQLANGLYGTEFRDIKAATEPGVWGAQTIRKPQTKTYSLIVRPHADVSLFYNFSDIFQSSDSNFRDVRGNPLRPSFGDTKDYGVKLSLLKDRLSVHLAKYETSHFDQIPQVNGNILTWSNQIWTALRDHHSPTGAMPDAAKSAQFDSEVRGLWRAYKDDGTKGYELTVAGRITNNWNVRLSAGKQTTILQTTHADEELWVTENMPLWQSYAALRNPAITNPADLRYTIGGTANEIRRQLNDVRSDIGLQQTSQRPYSLRLHSSYNFREGRLKGLTAGLGARWDSANILGFARSGATTATPFDVNSPYRGSELFDMDFNLSYSRKLFQDRVNWTVYLNVYNLLDEAGLRHRYAVDALNGTHDRLITERYTVAPRRFQLTNRLSF